MTLYQGERADMKVLITGGTGYIGAHVCLELLRANHRVAVTVKPLHHCRSVIQQVHGLSGGKSPFIFRADLRDYASLTNVLNAFKPHIVIHLAAVKRGDNTVIGNRYLQDVNVEGFKNLMEAMAKCDIRKLIFSSTREVTGPVDRMSGMARSKLMAEQALYTEVTRRRYMRAICLRLFDVGGAHPTGLLAEDEFSGSFNLINQMCQAATNERRYVTVSDDRFDFVHVGDIAKAFRLATERVARQRTSLDVFDIGTGKSQTSKVILKTFDKVSSICVPHFVVASDTPPPYIEASIDRTRALLNWSPVSTLDEVCQSAWFSHTVSASSRKPPPFSRIASCRVKM